MSKMLKRGERHVDEVLSGPSTKIVAEHRTYELGRHYQSVDQGSHELWCEVAKELVFSPQVLGTKLAISPFLSSHKSNFPVDFSPR